MEESPVNEELRNRFRISEGLKDRQVEPAAGAEETVTAAMKEYLLFAVPLIRPEQLKFLFDSDRYPEHLLLGRPGEVWIHFHLARIELEGFLGRLVFDPAGKIIGLDSLLVETTILPSPIIVEPVGVFVTVESLSNQDVKALSAAATQFVLAHAGELEKYTADPDKFSNVVAKSVTPGEDLYLGFELDNFRFKEGGRFEKTFRVRQKERKILFERMDLLPAIPGSVPSAGMEEDLVVQKRITGDMVSERFGDAVREVLAGSDLASVWVDGRGVILHDGVDGILAIAEALKEVGVPVVVVQPEPERAKEISRLLGSEIVVASESMAIIRLAENGISVGGQIILSPLNTRTAASALAYLKELGLLPWDLQPRPLVELGTQEGYFREQMGRYL